MSAAITTQIRLPTHLSRPPTGSPPPLPPSRLDPFYVPVFAWPPLTALKNVLLPTLGLPTQPMITSITQPSSFLTDGPVVVCIVCAVHDVGVRDGEADGGWGGVA